jgi:hypothetical protein
MAGFDREEGRVLVSAVLWFTREEVVDLGLWPGVLIALGPARMDRRAVE